LSDQGDFIGKGTFRGGGSSAAQISERSFADEIAGDDFVSLVTGQ
jgi:hypothetical protein